MGVPQRDVLEGGLPLVGQVPYRPLGQSHFYPAPWQRTVDTPYLPSVMSEEALRNGITKMTEDLPPQISEERLTKVEMYLEYKYGPIFGSDNLMSYGEAVARLNLDKSPGYPYYYTCEDKGCALTCFGDEIRDDVLSVIGGAEVWMPSTLTLKDELRTADRVRAGKTRVFSASNIVGLIVAKMLFDRQNEKLREHIGAHPLTIGITVPGPQFVQTVLSLSPERNCWPGDASGCDQRFYLPFARCIRNVRGNHLPAYVLPAVHLSYDQDFAGEVICCGGVYSGFHNKSGRNNTGDDNGLLLDCSRADYVMQTTGCQPHEVDDYSAALFNGDDSVTAWWGGLSAPGWRDHSKQFNLQLELGHEEPCSSEELVFLSHYIKERWVPGMGDILIAAGNRDKLLSSVEWIRKNADFTPEENALAHILGLRLCLWPWKSDFDDIEELIDEFVGRIEVTPRIRDILRARIPEARIIAVHTQLEGSFPFSDLQNMGVVPEIISAIFECVAMATNERPSKAELERRAAQSLRDKALQASKKEAGKKSEKKKAAKSDGVAVPVSQKPTKVRKTTITESAAVLSALMDPEHSPPFRLPGGAPTFVNRLRSVLQMAPPPAGSGNMQTNCGMMVVRRDARLGQIVYEYRGFSPDSTYSLRFPAANAGGGTPNFRAQVGDWIKPGILSNTSGWSRHDLHYVPVMYRDGLTRFWFQTEAATPSQLVFSGLVASTAYTFVVSFLCNGQEESVSLGGTSDASGNLTLTFGAVNLMGYAAVKFAVGSGFATGTLSIIDKSKNCYRHLAIPGLWSSGTDIDNVRVNAFSAMLSDRTAAMFTQGNCLSYQAGGGEDWTSLIGLSPTYNAAADPYALAYKSAKPFKGKYKDGRYIPCKPVGNPQERVMTEMFDDNALCSCSPIDMSLQCDYLYIGFNLGSLPDNTEPRAEWTAVWAIEGESESQWKQSEIPTIHPDTLKEAEWIFGQQECDFGNPDHLKKIWSWVKRNAPAVLGLVQSAAPLLPPQYRVPVMAGTEMADRIFRAL